MKRRVVVAVGGLVLVLAGLGIGFSWIGTPVEPVYQGRPLGWWLDQRARASQSGSLAQMAAADEAVRAVGAEALPILLFWIGRAESLASQTAEKLQRGLGLPTLVSTRQNRHRATQGLLALGPAARTAFPTLVAIALRSEDFGQRQDAVQALRLADPATMKLVAAGLQDPNRLVRLRAITALGCLPMAPDEVTMPALERATIDADPAVRAEAAATLARTQKNLANYATWLTAPDPMFRASGLSQIAGYRGRAKALLPLLETALHDPDPTVRQAASAAIGQVRGQPVP